ncbi:MAG TPA: glycoside hydrolase family 95 protein, partial [Luteolibacter sp.]|nr:glycoside hydrolase family 95 protein [Luteolibacter sp.]
MTTPKSFLSVLLLGSLSLPIQSAVAAPQVDPQTTLWYDEPATSWQEDALPIGNGRIGAMIFGGVGHERIALNEDTVWSGEVNEWNRPDAGKNLPEIRRLLNEGKNEAAEQLVNQTFTCTGGGSRGGARGPWGCFQELGNLRLRWGFEAPALPLQDWKLKFIEPSAGTKDVRDARSEAARLVELWSKPGTDTRDWEDYRIVDGKAVKGDRKLVNDQRVMLVHHLKLTATQLAQLGTLRVGAEARNGQVYVNGHAVGELAGWQASGHDIFSRDVSAHLVEGDNLIAIYCTQYRRQGQLPLSASLEPKETTSFYQRSLDVADAVATVRYTLGGVTYTREAFASAPDQVMVFRFTADKPGKISFTAGLDRLERFATTAVGDDGLLMTGSTLARSDKDGMQFVARLKALHSGGKVSTKGDQLVVDSADEAILLVSA